MRRRKELAFDAAIGTKAMGCPSVRTGFERVLLSSRGSGSEQHPAPSAAMAGGRGNEGGLKLSQGEALPKSPCASPGRGLLFGCRSSFLLRSPTALDGLSDALPSFRRDVSLLLFCRLRSGGCNGRNYLPGSACFLLRRRCGATRKQRARLLQLGNIAIDVCQNV
jgi:hypothetical protein